MTADEINLIAIDYRGRILNEVTSLEKQMDIYLAKYFCPKDDKKMNELFALVFAGLRITFENKRGILDYLCKESRIDIQEKYPKILSDMQDLFSDRKVFAHYATDTSEEAGKLPNGKIRFLSLNNKLDFKYYDEDYIRNLEDQMFRMTTLFLEKNLGG